MSYPHFPRYVRPIPPAQRHDRIGGCPRPFDALCIAVAVFIASLFIAALVGGAGAL